MFLMILSSGNLYFTVLNVKLTLVLMALTVVLLLRTFGAENCSQRNLKIFVIIIAVIMINALLNVNNGVRTNDMILWITRLIYLYMVHSFFTAEEFKSIYINIMCIEAAVSVVCYVLLNFAGLRSLPLEFTGQNDVNGYYLTLYYTIGWYNYPIFTRNAGFFWEPGAHQIYLNLALLFLISSMSRIEKKREFAAAAGKMFLLITAVFTTMSTSGYICLVVVLFSSLFVRERDENGGENRKARSRKLKMRIAAGLAVFLIAFAVVEMNLNVVSYKLGGGGSYTTRMNELLTGIELVSQSWLKGVGIFRTNRTYTPSNGMLSFMVSFGLPVSAVYLAAVYFGIKRLLDNDPLAAAVGFVFYLISLNSESIASYTLFLSFLFCWREEGAAIASCCVE